jgi:hypothetical protein
MEPTMQSSLFDLQIDQTAMSYLRDASKWARFLAIAGFIFCGFFVVVAILFATFLSGTLNSLGTSGMYGGLGAGFIAVVYIGIALLNFFPCLYLYNFGRKTKMALLNNDQDQLNISLKNMRAFFRYVGVLMIIGLGLFVLWFLLIIVSLGRTGGI